MCVRVCVCVCVRVCVCESVICPEDIGSFGMSVARTGLL